MAMGGPLLAPCFMDTKLLDTEKYFQSFEEEKPTYDYLLWEQGVGGSNPLTPTDGKLE